MNLPKELTRTQRTHAPLICGTCKEKIQIGQVYLKVKNNYDTHHKTCHIDKMSVV